MARYSLTFENADPQQHGGGSSPVASTRRTPAKDLYRTALASSILGRSATSKGPLQPKILAIQSPTNSPMACASPLAAAAYGSPMAGSQGATRRPAATRHVPLAPDKILDAPELADDYYLNLLDWSSG